MNKSLFLAVLLCTAVFCQSNCPSFYTGDLLQSGKNAIMRGKIGGNPEYSYEFPISFPVPAWGVEIAVSTGTIGDYSPLANYGYNYFIEANRKGSSNYIIYKLIMNNDESWSSIQLSYLACARPDMTVGNFEVPINEWVPATANVYNVYKTLSRDIPKTNYKVAAFISGFSTTDNEFTLTITKKAYDVDSKKLSVAFFCSANPAVLTLTITYIVFPETHQLLDIAYDLAVRGEVGAYQISGPVNFQPNKRIEYNEWRVENRFLPCTGNECENNLCMLREDCSKKGGNIFEGQCIFCAPGVVLEYGRCAKKCGANQVYSNRVCICAKGFVRKGKDCVNGKTCGTNQVWSDVQNGCVCAKGFANFNDQCKQCPDGSEVTADGKSCFCKSNDKIYDSFSNTCKNRCFENQQWANNKCGCIPNHCFWNKGCRRCPENSEPTADQATCSCKSQNAYYNAENNVCVECPAGLFLNKHKSACECQDGWNLKNGVCVSGCEDVEVWNSATKGCDCKPGYEKGADKKCRPKCGLGEAWYPSGCACVEGWVRYGGVCRQCPAGSVLNDQKTACICKDINQFFAVDKFACQTCAANSAPSADKTACVCLPGFTPSNGVCIRVCVDPEVQDGQGGCACKSGFVRNDKGVCVSRCTAQESWNGSNCNCLEGYARYGGVCRLCPAGSVPNDKDTACICKDINQFFAADKFACQTCQANSAPNADKTACVCLPGFTPSNGACIRICVDPEIQDGQGGCACKSGFVRNDKGVCVSRCTTQEFWNGNGCFCLDGYARYGGVCRQCPAGSIPNDQDSACVCKDINQFFAVDKFACQTCILNSAPNADKTACVCLPGFTPSNGACIRICVDPEISDVTTGGCTCKFGFVRNDKGVCVPRCAPKETWDGKDCLCLDGWAKYGGVCRQCPAGTFTNVLKTACICADANQIFLSDKFACQTCAAYSKPSADLSKCVCNDGYVASGSTCILNCGLNEQPNNEAGRCDCVFGFHRVNGQCVQRCTNLNEEWNGNKCICKPGFGVFKGVCTICPLDSAPNAQRTSCKCIAPTFFFNQATFKCEACPANSRNSEDDTQCVCNPGFEKLNGICSPKCDVGEELNVKTNECDCKYGFLRLGPLCVERCGLNQEWNGKDCVCKENHVTGSGACRPCPDNNGTNPKRTTCICKDPKHIFDFGKFGCVPLPSNCGHNEDYTDFVCYPGYKKENGACVNACPAGAVPDQTGQCYCSGGYYLEGNVCKKPLSCPARSSWDAATLTCLCDTRGEYLIDGVCKPCGDNSVYSSSAKKCICATGFNLVGGECIVCDPRTKYNGTDCVCNLGHFGNRDKCNKCHSSCSQCSGPEANQCLSCSDVSLVLQNGFCSKNTPCDPGFYLSESCAKCTDNCIICDDIFQCQQCAVGYQIEKLEIGDQKIQACTEICGDGIKYQAECDDSNTANGDGCSSECTIEPGWSCSGGSSTQKSKCVKYIPEESILTSKGVVNLGDRVVQSVRASYLPTCLTDNECSKCFKVLKANVVDSNVPVLVKVNFVPFSQYQFLIEYNFQGLYVTSKFKTVIRFNDDFKGCLADDDFNQQIELAVDPAFLAKVDVEQTLTLDQITPGAQPKIDIPAAANKLLGIKK